MRVIISAGGTGGHIYPALAIINKIKEKEPDSEFLYIGTHNRMEKDIVPKRGIPFETIEIYGVYRKKIYKNVKTVYCMLKSYQKCKKIVREFRPDVVIGVGGYVTAPVLKAAKKYHIPTFIHEQNSVPGASNQYLMKFVDKIGVSFPSSIDYFPKEKTVYTGNPCSEDALKQPAIAKVDLGLSEHKKLVLIVMGSLGSSKVNEMMMESFSLFAHKDYQLLFVTGKESYEEVSRKEFPENVKVVPYVEGMPRVMKKTDVMISRAGASTLSEIIALEVPSILIPSPYVPNNHQYKNAMDLVELHAADILEEKDFTKEALVEKVDNLMKASVRVEMKQNLRKLQVPDSAERIYRCIRELIGEKDEDRT